MVRATAVAIAILPMSLGMGCSPSAEPREQLLVVVDTDLPVTGEIGKNPSMSADAAVDSVRVDVLGAKGDVSESFLAIAPDSINWPVSFGVVVGETKVTLRIRAFRAAWATSGTVTGSATLDPPPLVSIDRLVEIPAPDDGIVRWRVMLSGDCLGVPVSFLPASSCIDKMNQKTAPTSGITRVENAGPTRAGSWAGAHDVPCTGVAPAGSVCIPGGFSVLGSAGLLADDVVSYVDAYPLRPVLLSPFFMDATEYTVGRFEQALIDANGTFTAPMPRAYDASKSPYCTRGAPNATDLPLNCVAIETARALCALDGGTLPSEAEWEHAARGRGERNTYPWGNQTAECCTSDLGHGQVNGCPSTGATPVAQHAGTDCPTGGDVTRDGVFDLGGSVQELVQDTPVAYSAPPWSDPGVPRDPVVNQPGVTLVTVRGGSWTEPFHFANSAWRRGVLTAVAADSQGLRCVYPASVKP